MFILNTNWDALTRPFVENFTQNVFGGNVPLIGLLIILFFLMFILSLRFSVSLMAVIMIPILFWVNSWAGMNDLLVIAGILFGGIIGAALIKWYHKR